MLYKATKPGFSFIISCYCDFGCIGACLLLLCFISSLPCCDWLWIMSWKWPIFCVRGTWLVGISLTFWLRDVMLLWPPCIADDDIIFLPCDFYLSFFIPCLMSAVAYWMSTILRHMMNACLRCAARGLLEIQDAKNRHLCTIAQLCRAISSQLRHVSTITKNLLNCNTSPTSLQYGELRPTNGWVGAPQQISTGFASWQRYCTAL